jgi:hypothetical protein
MTAIAGVSGVRKEDKRADVISGKMLFEGEG